MAAGWEGGGWAAGEGGIRRRCGVVMGQDRCVVMGRAHRGT